MELLSKEEIAAYQLDILDTVHNFCVKNHFTYFLSFGTLLGAIRHNGYIPWDDDIDIMMYRDEYDAFIAKFNAENTKYHAFSIADEGYNLYYCKICNLETEVIDDDLRFNEMNLGINIDLFPLDKLPETVDCKSLNRKMQYFAKAMFGAGFLKERFKYRPLRQRALIMLYKMLSLGNSERSLCVKVLATAKTYDKSDTDRYSVFIAGIGYRYPIIHRNTVVPVKHLFEGKEYFIPSSYDEFLTTSYGDYMTPPDMTHRNSGHDFKAYRK